MPEKPQPQLHRCEKLKTRMDLSGLGQRQVAGSCERGIERLVSYKEGNFLIS